MWYYYGIIVGARIACPHPELSNIGKVDDGRPMTAPTISTVMNQMKGYVTKQIGFSIWQKLFHDHIVRNEAEYQKIQEYIDTNQLKWQDDCYYDKNNG